MKVQYCWRCKMEIPMLDEVEWASFEPMLNSSLRRTKEIRGERGCGIREAQAIAYLEALSEFERLTGFKETNIEALHHHRLALFGPPCTDCSKPLRTPMANQCAECGAIRGAWLNHSSESSPRAWTPLAFAMAVQVFAVLVMVFGDIGFDRPGRFGLDFEDLLLLLLIWGVAILVGLVLAWRSRGTAISWLQCLVLYLEVLTFVGALT